MPRFEGSRLQSCRQYEKIEGCLGLVVLYQGHAFGATPEQGLTVPQAAGAKRSGLPVLCRRLKPARVRKKWHIGTTEVVP